MANAENPAPLAALVVASLKQQILMLLGRYGTLRLPDTALTDPCVRAVAELVQERKCIDDYPNGELRLYVTRKGAE